MDKPRALPYWHVGAISIRSVAYSLVRPEEKEVQSVMGGQPRARPLFQMLIECYRILWGPSVFPALGKPINTLAAGGNRGTGS